MIRFFIANQPRKLDECAGLLDSGSLKTTKAGNNGSRYGGGMATIQRILD